MRCPFCGHDESKVMDSRFRKEGNVIRRRRECLQCARRFTTYERVEEFLPHVVKKDGRREPFDRQKIFNGISRACEKLAISIDQMEELVNEVERHFSERGEREIASKEIGEYVIARLRDLSPVAYVRFASVYKSFKDVDDFMAELKVILSARKGT
jgi:transcriptional repressor NrdR